MIHPIREMRSVLIISGGFYLFVTALSFYVDSRLLLVSALLVVWIGFVFYFVRNPERSIPQGENLILAPSDGRIMTIQKGAAIKIHIFLSLFDVHINRIPIRGIVKDMKYQPGSFSLAFLSKSVKNNERNRIQLQTEYGIVQFSQIAGLIARRIVCSLRKGQTVQKGEVIGMIKFGSGVEMILPSSVRLSVKVGERIRAGETIIGRFINET